MDNTLQNDVFGMNEYPPPSVEETSSTSLSLVSELEGVLSEEDAFERFETIDRFFKDFVE